MQSASSALADPPSGQAGTNDERRAPPWTPSFLGFVLPLRRDQVVRDEGATRRERREWEWIALAQRLVWQYGAAEAIRRLNFAPCAECLAPATCGSIARCVREPLEDTDRRGPELATA